MSDTEDLAAEPFIEDTNELASWEKPWTIDEMRFATDEWTLASDSGLLLYLKQFSDQLIEKTKEIGNEMDQLVLSVKTTDVSVRNTFNEFMMLSHRQFVENRVEAFEEDTPQPAESTTADDTELNYNQLQSLRVPKYKSAIGSGLEVLQQSLLAKDEFDFETELKNEYSKNPLPFVIGSREFKEAEFCGLSIPYQEEDELFDDEVVVENSEEGKEEIGEEEDDEYDDYTDGSAKEEEEEEYGEEEEEKFDIKEQGVKLLPDGASGINLKKASNEDPTGWGDSDNEETSLFGGEQASSFDEGEESLFGEDEELFGSAGSKNKNVKKMGVSVFPEGIDLGKDLSSDSEEDSDDLPPPPTPAGGDGGEEEEDEISGEEMDTKKPKFGQQVLPTGMLSGITSSSILKNKEAQGSSLFGDEEEDLFGDDEPLFSSKTAPKEEKNEEEEQTSEDDFLGGPAITTKKESTPASSAKESDTSAGLFSDDLEEDSFFSFSSKPKDKEPSKDLVSDKKTLSAKKTSSSLFDIDADDLFADFDLNSSSKASSPSKASSSSKKATTSSFADDNDLFGDSELFGMAPDAEKSKKDSAADSLALPTDDNFLGLPTNADSEGDDLFSAPPPKESSVDALMLDDDFFGLPPAKSKESESEGLPLVVDTPSDDFLGLPTTKEEEENFLGLPQMESPIQTNEATDDFFNEPSATEKDLFAPTGAANANTPPQPKKSVEEDLFGSSPPKANLDTPIDDFLLPTKTEPSPLHSPVPSPSPVKKTAKKDSKISKLQMNLNLSMDKMMPGAAGSALKKELRDPNSISAVPESDGPAPKLDHPTKSRPMMSGKRAPSRRRPSRNPRAASTRKETKASTPAPVVKEEPPIRLQNDTTPKVKNEKSKAVASPPKAEKTQDIPKPAEMAETEPLADTKNIFDNELEDALFSPPPKKTKATDINFDDLMSTPLTKTTPTPNSKPPAAKASDFDFDDIFSGPKGDKKETVTPKKRKIEPKESKKESVDSGLPDSIFEDAPKREAKKVTKKAASGSKTKSSAASDLDDIFGDIF